MRSDILPNLIDLAENLSALSPTLQGFMKFQLVVDANIIRAELRWRLKQRRKECARTDLYEAIVAEVLVVFAPTTLESEIFEHEEEIARIQTPPLRRSVVNGTT
jgi:hypothetical protein